MLIKYTINAYVLFESMSKSSLMRGIFHICSEYKCQQTANRWHVNKYLLKVEISYWKQGKRDELNATRKKWGHCRALFHSFITVNRFIQLMSPLNVGEMIEKNERNEHLLLYAHYSLIIIIRSECSENGKWSLNEWIISTFHFISTSFCMDGIGNGNVKVETMSDCLQLFVCI